MRFFTLLALLAVLLTTVASGQPLTAHAGPDKAWCDTWFMPNADTPVLGGYPAATGGTAPYTYEWSIPYTSTIYLNNRNADHPKVTGKPYNEDSLQFVLKVTDASGSTVFDSTWVYFQKVICALGTTVVYKHPTDTILIDVSGGGCFSRFQPYSERRWRPADYLVDSTAYPARCYSPVSKNYDLYLKDRIGCPLRSRMQVYVSPASVTNTSDENTFLHFDAITRTVTAQISGKGQVQLLDMTGKVAWEESFSGTSKGSLPASLPPGLYLATLRNEKSQLLIRQKLTL